MKKQYTYLAVGCAVVLGLATVTYAQKPVVTPISATGTATTTVSKKVRLQEAVTKMERSLEVRITALDGLAGRIETRIQKIQLTGKDMTAASAKLAEAKARIAEAKTELANLKKADVAMVASTRPATAFANIKNKLAKNVTVKIKAAHKALVDTIVLMKGQGMPGSATSSTSTVR